MNLAGGWGNMQALDDVGYQWFSLPILMMIRESCCNKNVVHSVSYDSCSKLHLPVFLCMENLDTQWFRLRVHCSDDCQLLAFSTFHLYLTFFYQLSVMQGVAAVYVGVVTAIHHRYSLRKPVFRLCNTGSDCLVMRSQFEILPLVQ